MPMGYDIPMTLLSLLIAMLDKLDIPTEKFGDSSGVLQI